MNEIGKFLHRLQEKNGTQKLIFQNPEFAFAICQWTNDIDWLSGTFAFCRTRNVSATSASCETGEKEVICWCSAVRPAPASATQTGREVWIVRSAHCRCRCLVVNFHKLHIRAMSAARPRYYTIPLAARLRVSSRTTHRPDRQRPAAQLVWHAE